MTKVYELPKEFHPDFAVPNRKPIGPVELKTNYTVAALLDGAQNRNLATNKVLTSDIQGRRHSNRMIGAEFVGASNHKIDLPLDMTGKQFSVVVHGVFDTTGTHTLTGTASSISGGAAQFRFSSGKLELIKQNIAVIAQPSHTAVSVGEPFVAGLVLDNGTSYAMFLNGVKLDSGTPSSCTVSDFYMGYRNGSTAEAWDGVGFSVFATEDLLTDAEMLRLTRDLYRSTLEPAIPQSYFIPSAGGGAYTIVGDVTVTATPSSAATYNLNASIAGSTTHTATPAGSFTYNLNASISGDVTHALTSSATLDYNSGSEIVGDVTHSVTGLSALDYTQNASIVGGASVSIGSSAGLDYSASAVIAGSVGIDVNSSATLDYAQNASISGSVGISWAPTSSLLYSSHYSISGSSGVALSVAAALDYSSHKTISGDVSYSLEPTATLDYTQNISLSGALTYQFDSAAIMSYIDASLVTPGARTCTPTSTRSCSPYSESRTNTVHTEERSCISILK